MKDLVQIYRWGFINAKIETLKRQKSPKRIKLVAVAYISWLEKEKQRLLKRPGRVVKIKYRGNQAALFANDLVDRFPTKRRINHG